MRPIQGPAAASPSLAEYLTGTAMVSGILWLLLRQWRTLDGHALTLSGWSCLGRVAPGKATGLGEVTAVMIDRQAKIVRCRDAPDSVDDVDSVWLLDRGGKRLLLDSFSNKPFEARQTAESVSRLLGVEYRDTTCSPPDIKKSSELDESLGQRYLRTAKTLPQPQEPTNLRFRCLASPEGLEIRIPRAQLVDFWRPLGWGLGLSLALTVLLIYFCRDVAGFVLLVLLFMLLPVALPWIWTAWPASRLTESLRLSRRSLQVDSTLYGHHEIPLTELEDLFLRDYRQNRVYRNYQTERYFPVGCLCARSDRVQACFGGSLDEDNLEYLRALLVKRIVESTRAD